MNSYDFFEIDNIKYFNKTLSSVRISIFNRQNLNNFLKSEAANKPAVYILFNISNITKDSAYIGETENIGLRLEQHNKNLGKTFWTETIVCQTVDDSFNKAHYKHLEYIFYERALHANRFDLANLVSPTKSSLSIKDKISINIFMDEIVDLLLKLRIFIFEHPIIGNTVEDTDIFYLYHPFGTGKLRVKNNDQFEILKDSIIIIGEENKDPFYQKKMDGIKSQEIKMVDDTKIALVLKNIIFDSDNDAAAYVTGNSESDWTLWKNINAEGINIKKIF